ncbi:MAG: MATE family efflux transporter [Acidobacteriota bacterium]
MVSGPVQRELRRVASLATPVALTQLSSMLLWTVDVLMVGRVSVEALDAVSLGRLWLMGTGCIGMGFVFGLDALASQAHGARDRERLGDALLHGSALALLLSVPLGALLLATERVLLALGQDPVLAAAAHRFVVVQVPGLPFFLLFIALKQYLQARGIVRPGLWISLIGNVINLFLNWLLIYGHWGCPRLEVVGAGIATAVTEVFMALALIAVMRMHRLQRGADTVLDPRKVRRAGLAQLAGVGAPVALQLALEYWAFAAATLLAGRLGRVELAAHSIALNLSSIAYMVPLGISFAAATRVGNLIGAGDRDGAQRTAGVALGLGAAAMGGFAALFVLGRWAIPSLYSGDAAVIAAAAALLPIAAAFGLFDGVQCVGGGILRGMGRTRPAAVFNFIGYYAFAMPLAGWLGTAERFGLEGIWWGLALGLAVIAVALVLWIWRRGPATATALVSR